MDYIIMNRLQNGEFKPITFKDGVVPIYHSKDEAISDMAESDVLFRIEIEKENISK